MGVTCVRRKPRILLRNDNSFLRTENKIQKMYKTQNKELLALAILDGEATLPDCPRKPPVLHCNDSSLEADISRIDVSDVSKPRVIHKRSKTPEQPLHSQKVKWKKRRKPQEDLAKPEPLDISSMQVEKLIRIDPYDRLHQSVIGPWKPISKDSGAKSNSMKLLKPLNKRLKTIVQNQRLEGLAAVLKAQVPLKSSKLKVRQLSSEASPAKQKPRHLPRLASTYNSSKAAISASKARTFSQNLLKLGILKSEQAKEHS